MSSIKILPEILANQIAAGEVVERPASVVKELVENALDAAASRILITIHQGGMKSIEITDNGYGMDSDDLLLSLERHATSKIKSPDDLFAIHTLGFRGEALPSIASVCRMTITSKPAQAEVASQVMIEAGRIKKVQPAAATTGTGILVQNLFYNLPARKKFLKSVATEFSHILDVVSCYALANPAVQFKLWHNDRLILDAASAEDGLSRVAAVLGRDIVPHLIPLSRQTDLAQVTGYLSHPHFNRPSTRELVTFVNRRRVKDRTVNHAVLAGYERLLMKGRYPVAVIFLDLPPQMVDVNVHPTKHEVRFRRQKDIHDLLVQAVSQALTSATQGITEWLESSVPAGPEVVGQPDSFDLPVPDPDSVKPAQETPRLPQPRPSPATPRQDQLPLPRPLAVRPMPWAPPPEYPTGRPFRVSESPQDYQAAPAIPDDHPTTHPIAPSAEPPAIELPQDYQAATENHTSEPPAIEPAPVLSVLTQFSRLRLIGHLRDSYLVGETPGGLLLIDQHAAHERILFEDLKRAYHGTGIPRQILLFPQSLEISPKDAALLDTCLPLLEELGVELTFLGGGTYAVKTVPVITKNFDVKAFIHDLVSEVGATGGATKTGGLLDQVLIGMACKGAIKANQALTREEMTSLLLDLDRVPVSATCPHGRPLWQLIPFGQIERGFRR
ncbi:MAG: DNA mismatch repair endonuclease MutL [Deltaproteobacteria bacterium]|nr:DNA mismatch repair endonuclease MutL [Deltaproteobacteria bacterium]